MILDSHTHVYPEKIAAKAAENLGHFYNFIVQESGTLSTLEDCCKNNGIGGFLLLPVSTSAAHTDRVNEIAAENVKRAREDGFEAYSFGGMHQDYPDFEAGVAHIKELGLLGVKIHPDLQEVDIDDQKLFPLYKALEDAGLRLFFHTGDDRPEYNFSDPAKLCTVCEKFPKLQIVGAHLGGYKEWDKVINLLAGKYDNLWYDLSQCHNHLSPTEVRALIEKLGTDRVFFGSDYPATTPKASLDAFNLMGFDKETYDNIAYRNLRRFLGVE